MGFEQHFRCMNIGVMFKNDTFMAAFNIVIQQMLCNIVGTFRYTVLEVAEDYTSHLNIGLKNGQISMQLSLETISSTYQKELMWTVY